MTHKPESSTCDAWVFQCSFYWCLKWPSNRKRLALWHLDICAEKIDFYLCLHGTVNISHSCCRGVAHLDRKHSWKCECKCCVQRENHLCWQLYCMYGQMLRIEDSYSITGISTKVSSWTEQDFFSLKHTPMRNSVHIHIKMYCQLFKKWNYILINIVWKYVIIFKKSLHFKCKWNKM